MSSSGGDKTEVKPGDGGGAPASDEPEELDDEGKPMKKGGKKGDDSEDGMNIKNFLMKNAVPITGFFASFTAIVGGYLSLMSELKQLGSARALTNRIGPRY